MTYEQIIKKLKDELNTNFHPLQYKLRLSKENKHVHFIYQYQKGELDTDEKIEQSEEKLTLCANNVYETLSDIDNEFNDVYNPASCFFYKDRFMADFIVLYRDKK